MQDKPALFSTFLMWLLADLHHDLPEVGDLDRPKLVFFFDEAHLLFKDASKDFLDQIAQTVRLIRSKGVGVFFVTQVPTDVPPEVLAQLGNRVQHALRVFTPQDAKALSSTVSTFPRSQVYELDELLPSLGIGEAVVTVLSETGAPTPVAWTRLRPPTSLMAQLDPAEQTKQVQASPIAQKYAAGARPRVGLREAAGEVGGRPAAAEPEQARRRSARAEQRREQGAQDDEDPASATRCRPCSARARSRPSPATSAARSAARSPARCSGRPAEGAEPLRSAGLQRGFQARGQVAHHVVGRHARDRLELQQVAAEDDPRHLRDERGGALAAVRVTELLGELIHQLAADELAKQARHFRIRDGRHRHRAQRRTGLLGVPDGQQRAQRPLGQRLRDRP